MWVFLRDSFLSIVADQGSSNMLLVRARIKGDIERCFPRAGVLEVVPSDYRYRAFIERKEVATVLAEAVASISYPNFKAAVTDGRRHSAYLDVWSAMHRAQDKRPLFLESAPAGVLIAVICPACGWQGRRKKRLELPCPQCAYEDVWIT